MHSYVGRPPAATRCADGYDEQRYSYVAAGAWLLLGKEKEKEKWYAGPTGVDNGRLHATACCRAQWRSAALPERGEITVGGGTQHLCTARPVPCVGLPGHVCD